jgi:hypothetical protein
MGFTKVASQSFEASSIELALAASKAFMYMELWMWRRAVRTDRDAAWVSEYAWVLTQILRKSLSKFSGDAVLSVEVGRDL